MYRIINILIFLTFALSLTCNNGQAAWPWSKNDQSLVKINGISYSADDYLHWWENWSGKDNDGPKDSDLQQFIERKLLVQEALSMELDQNPSLKRQNEVYLGVQRRLHFKRETVDSKISITEEDRRERFKAEYNPVSYFTFLSFRFEESANNALKLLHENGISFDQLKNMPESEGGPHNSISREYYPRKLIGDSKLNNAIRNLKVGEVSGVIKTGRSFVIALLENQVPPDESYYNRRKSSIHSKIVKEQNAILTSKLIESLWQKYDVQVNEALFSQAGPDKTGDILNQPIATTNKVGIPFKLLVKDIRKEHSYRKVDQWPEESRTELYRGLLNGMIIEYLITWESIERRYEERSPLKWSYEYYQEKNLVRELEKVLLRPRVSVSDDEIKKFYQEHIEDFKHPDLYTVTILKAEKDLIDSIWQEVNRGGDISKLANRNDVKLSSLNNVDVERLPLEVREAVQQLNNNQVSSPLVMEDGEYVMVKLLARTRNEARPLESVKEEIRKKLSPQKFQQVRDEYVEKVMNLSEIEINRKNWDKLIADLKK
jgi:hypothetical protein